MSEVVGMVFERTGIERVEECGFRNRLGLDSSITFVYNH